MKEHLIDVAAKEVLLKSDYTMLDDIDLDDRNTVRDRVLDIPFDCTPNWGINGVVVANNLGKAASNWYLQNPEYEARLTQRVANIDKNKLSRVVQIATRDIIDDNLNILGYSIYGSYLYGESTIPPEDLDVLVIIDDIEGIALDALRYRYSNLKDVFHDPNIHTPRVNDLGLTIVSKDQLRPSNLSLVVTDAALIDVSTTHSYYHQVEAPEPPPFLLIGNAHKLVGWGLSLIGDDPRSTARRLDESLKMRNFVDKKNPNLALPKFKLEEYLSPSENLTSITNENILIGLSRILMKQLNDDGTIIRQYVAENI